MPAVVLKTERQIILSRRLVPRVCGVYFLLKGERIIYVGQSLDVMARLGDHANSGKDFDAYNYVKCARADLSSLERQYIDRFRPPLNRDRATLSPIIRFRELETELGLLRNALVPPSRPIKGRHSNQWCCWRKLNLRPLPYRRETSGSFACV